MFGQKKSSNYDKMMAVGEENNVRNRDVHAEQQMERSEIGEKKSMTSRIVLVSIASVIVMLCVWMILSIFEAGMDAAKGSNAFDVFFHPEDVSYQTELQPDEFGEESIPGSRLDYIPVTIYPGYATPQKLGFATKLSADVSDTLQPSAEHFWSIVDIDGEEQTDYVEFLNMFFRPSGNTSASYLGRYNGKPYTKLDVWDVWSDVTGQQHWKGYLALFDTEIESVLSYQEFDASDGRPEYVGASTQAPVENPVQDPNPVVTEPGGDITSEPGSDVPVTQPADDPNTQQGEPQTPVEPAPSVPQKPSDETKSGTKNYFLSFKLWKVFGTLLSGFLVWCFGYLVMKKNLDAQNQLEDISVLNQYTNDQHIQFPQEMMAAYDWFPDAGAHSDVCVSSMLSHVMLEKKGLKNVDMVKRAEKDIIGPDGEVEYLKGEILLDESGQPIYESVPIIDEKFSTALFDSASVVDKKDRRVKYVVTDIPYNPPTADSPHGRYRDKLPDAKTVADMINKYWTIPYYEPQRPAGAYLVDTAPSNTMVLAITRAG